MSMRLAHLTLLAVLLALAFTYAAIAEPRPEIRIAQGETETEPKAAPQEKDPGDVFEPKTYKTTPAEVEECMKSWDPETGMSKEEYRKSCEQTLKYFPEEAD